VQRLHALFQAHHHLVHTQCICACGIQVQELHVCACLWLLLQLLLLLLLLLQVRNVLGLALRQLRISPRSTLNRLPRCASAVAARATDAAPERCHEAALRPSRSCVVLLLSPELLHKWLRLWLWRLKGVHARHHAGPEGC
jgi:hypothetical protein